MKRIINPDGTHSLLKHGKGKQTWDNGSEYDGFWHENLMQGKGKFIHSN